MGAGKTLKGEQQNLQFLDRQMTIDTYEYTVIYNNIHTMWGLPSNKPVCFHTMNTVTS